MKLIGYEFRKVLSGKFWAIALCSLLVLNTVLFLEPWNHNPLFSFREAYQRERPLLDFLDSADTEAYQEYVNSITGQLGDDWETSEGFIDVPMNNTPGRFLATESMELSTLTGPLRLMQYNLYPEVLEKRADIVALARQLGKTAYEEGNDYEIRLNLDIIHRYSIKPAPVPQFATAENIGHFSVYRTKGWERFLSYQWSDLFVLLITLLISANIFSQEQKAAPLLYTTRFGRSRTTGAKLTTAGIYAVVISLLFSGLNFALAVIQYGLGGADASILSLYQQMSAGPLTLTLGQTALLFTAFRTFGAVCVALVTAFISFLSHNNLTAYICSVLFLGASFGFHYLVGMDAGLSMGLRLLPDVTIWTRPMWMFEEYRVANVFSFPVLWAWICLIFWFLLCTGIYAAAIRYSEKRKQVAI